MIWRRHAAIAVACWLLAAALDSDSAVAQSQPTGEALWYYQLGGGKPVLDFSAGAELTQLPLFKGGVKWNPNACGAFDIETSLENHLADAKRSLYSLERNLLDQAEALLRIGALTVLQRANPGLYDLVTRILVEAKADFAVAIKNCEQVERDFAAGANPLHGWLRAALYADWSRGDSRPSAADPVAVQQRVETSPGASGIPWVQGEAAGGNGQAPIRVASDVAAAGYQMWQTDNSEQRLTQLWPDAAAAAEWTREVVGETEVRFCSDCERFTTEPGVGLQRELHRGRERAKQLLTGLIESPGRPAPEVLAELHNPGLGIGMTVAVVQSLRDESPANRSILLDRLASDIALAHAMEKALIARQLLRAGRRATNVAENAEAQREIERMLARLDEEMNGILFEQRIRSEVLSRTALIALQRQQQPVFPPRSPSVPLSLSEDGGRSDATAE